LRLVVETFKHIASESDDGFLQIVFNRIVQNSNAEFHPYPLDKNISRSIHGGNIANDYYGCEYSTLLFPSYSGNASRTLNLDVFSLVRHTSKCAISFFRDFHTILNDTIISSAPGSLRQPCNWSWSPSGNSCFLSLHANCADFEHGNDVALNKIVWMKNLKLWRVNLAGYEEMFSKMNEIDILANNDIRYESKQSNNNDLMRLMHQLGIGKRKMEMLMMHLPDFSHLDWAKNASVFIVSSDTASITIALNTMETMQKQYLPTLLLVYYSDAACKGLAIAFVQCYSYSNKWFNSLARSLNVNKKIMYQYARKVGNMLASLQLLRSGYNVQLTHADQLLFRNPLNYIMQNTDITVSCRF